MFNPKRISSPWPALTLAMLGGCGEPVPTADPNESVELQQRPICESQPSGWRPDFTTCSSTPWPQGRIPYSFDNTAGTWTNAEKDAVRTAMNDWEGKTSGFIRFVEEPANVERVLLKWDGGCRADIGWQSGAGTQNASVRGCGEWGMRHELGHAIGLYHHHQRADRNRYVLLRESVLCSSTDHYNNNLVRCQGGDKSDYGPYNLWSIMHYGSDFPAGCNASTCSLVTKQGYMINLATTVAPEDASAVMEMYLEPKGWQRYRPVVSADPGPTAYLDTRPAATAALSGSPALARWGASGVVSVVRGTDNAIYVKFNSGGLVNWPTGYWQNIGNGFYSDPAATSWADGRLDVVAVGADGNLYHKWNQSGAWAGSWGNLGRPDSNAISAPAIASWGPDRLDIFVRSGDRLYQKTWNAGWTGWQELPNSCCVQGKPGAVSWGSGRIDVVALNVFGVVHHRAFDGGSWYGWTSLGEVARSGTSPAIASKAPYTLDIYVTSSNRRVLHQWWSGGWSGFYEIGGMPTGSPAAVGTPAGAAHLIIGAGDVHGGLWHRRWN